MTPRFPDGLTQLSGLGQFAVSVVPVEERSKVLLLKRDVGSRSPEMGMHYRCHAFRGGRRTVRVTAHRSVAALRPPDSQKGVRIGTPQR